MYGRKGDGEREERRPKEIGIQERREGGGGKERGWEEGRERGRKGGKKGGREGGKEGGSSMN